MNDIVSLKNKLQLAENRAESAEAEVKRVTAYMQSWRYIPASLFTGVYGIVYLGTVYGADKNVNPLKHPFLVAGGVLAAVCFYVVVRLVRWSARVLS